MAVESYLYVEVSKVYGYDSYGTFRGVKVLQEVYIPETNDYRFIVQSGSAKQGEDFVPYNDGKDLTLYTLEELKQNFDKRFKKDDPSFKKGDILEGLDRNDKRVVLLFESKDKVHRLTHMNDSLSDRSTARLAYYQGQLKGIKALTSAYDGKKFSEI